MWILYSVSMYENHELSWNKKLVTSTKSWKRPTFCMDKKRDFFILLFKKKWSEFKHAPAQRPCWNCRYLWTGYQRVAWIPRLWADNQVRLYVWTRNVTVFLNKENGLNFCCRRKNRPNFCIFQKKTYCQS